MAASDSNMWKKQLCKGYEWTDTLMAILLIRLLKCKFLPLAGMIHGSQLVGNSNVTFKCSG